MRVVMAHLLRTLRFELLPDQDLSPVAVPMLMQKDGRRVWVKGVDYRLGIVYQCAALARLAGAAHS
jgi:hypothetical protein